MTLSTFFILVSANSQVEYLRLSPLQKIEQRVGMTDLSIAFSRPQMKGRQIFGDLVPFGKMWRTGANENTTFTTNHRMKIGDTEVVEGTYTLWTKPGRNLWDIYFYKDTGFLDVPNEIDSTKLLYLTTVSSNQTERVIESLTINFHDLTETSANLSISWENTEVFIPMNFYTQEAMEKKMKAAFKQNVFDYSIAASYYSERDIELLKAKKLQELSMELRESQNSWSYFSYGRILKKLGESAQAKKVLMKSLSMAEEEKNDYLIKENQKLLAELK